VPILDRILIALAILGTSWFLSLVVVIFVAHWISDERCNIDTQSKRCKIAALKLSVPLSIFLLYRLTASFDGGPEVCCDRYENVLLSWRADKTEAVAMLDRDSRCTHNLAKCLNRAIIRLPTTWW